MGVPYAEQLDRKRARLVRALAHFPHLVEPDPIVGSDHTFAYRHRLKLPVAIRKDEVSIGLYATKGRSVLDTPDCPVLADGLRAVIPSLKDWLRGRRGIHSVDLRVSSATGECQLILACRGGELDGGPRAARALVRDVPTIASVAVSTADKAGKRVMGSRPRVLAGKAALEESIGPVRYDLLPGSFFQVDPRHATVLHRLVSEAVGEARSVLDLYSGVGAYALMLAGQCDRVVAVEEVPAAVKAARKRAPRHVRILEGKVEDVRLDGRFDVAILNPARRGSDLATLRRLPKLARRAVYVSCGPETLARDLDILSAHGMRATRIVPVDLFPQTPEVESVVHLERAPARQTWSRGRVQSPWFGKPSGCVGRADEALALVLNRVRPGTFGAAEVEVVDTVAGHSFVRLKLSGPLNEALKALARRGHPVAGRERKTARFFAEKAGLLRPFVHVSRAGKQRAPLHGDLKLALEALQSDRPQPPPKRSKKKPKRR